MMNKPHGNLHKIFTNHLPFRKKTMETRIIKIFSINKNIFNKSEGRCRDVKTQKAFEQGWEVNVGPKI